MFEWRKPKIRPVTEGTIYQRLHKNNLMEEAEVLWIGEDSFGIPHVRFNVRFKGLDHPSTHEGTRTLALSIFAEQFTPAEQAA